MLVLPLGAMLVHSMSPLPLPHIILSEDTPILPAGFQGEKAVTAATKEEAVMVSCLRAHHRDPAASKITCLGVQFSLGNGVNAS